MNHTARILVRPAAVAANLAIMRQRAPGVAAAAVVKADAYGLGLDGLLPAFAACNVFFVARLSEGTVLRELRPDARIFVLDGAPRDQITALIAHRLVPVLGNLAEIADWQAAAYGHEAALHVDTGMNRLGLPPEELSVLAAEARTRLAGIKLALVMSHLACSDDPASPMNGAQLSRFRAALAQLPAAPASLAASGGVFLGDEYHFDMIRPGIGLYGGHPHPGHGSNPMQAAATLLGRVLQVRQIGAGESVGYGAAFQAKKPSLIATIALGYADGVLRAAAPAAGAMIRGRRAPFVGRVSMDLITLDVTDIAGVAVGDEAELFGPRLPVDQAAESWGTIAYELLTGLSRRIPRAYEDGPQNGQG